jgi:hypothetical protein
VVPKGLLAWFQKLPLISRRVGDLRCVCVAVPPARRFAGRYMKAMKPIEAIPGMTGPVPNFKGLPLPEGVDRHNLYQSAFRVVTTYAMPLADLDNELQAILTKKSCTVKADDRRNFVGKSERNTRMLAHVPAALFSLRCGRVHTRAHSIRHAARPARHAHARTDARTAGLHARKRAPLLLCCIQHLSQT